jgi:acetyl esterase
VRLGPSHLIDPELLPLVDASRDFYAGRPARRGPADRAELYAVRAAAPPPPAVHPPPLTELVRVEDRSVVVRIHLPAGDPTGVLLDVHGGGFFLGSAAGSDVRNRQLADSLGLVVVSVDHRLAPEHPWPAAPDDCETAALWLAAHAADRFGTTALAVTGFSSGATLAMTTLLRLRDRGSAALTAGVLQFGTYDLSGLTPAGRLFADEYFLQAYAGAAPDRTHPDLSPVYADLTGLPPLLMVVGEDDVLLEDNLAMAARLAAARVDVELRVHPASPHGFTGHPTPMARAALAGIEEWLADRLAAGS